MRCHYMQLQKFERINLHFDAINRRWRTQNISKEKREETTKR